MCSHAEMSPQNSEAAMGPKLFSSRRGMDIHLFRWALGPNHKFRMIKKFLGYHPCIEEIAPGPISTRSMNLGIGGGGGPVVFYSVALLEVETNARILVPTTSS